MMCKTKQKKTKKSVTFQKFSSSDFPMKDESNFVDFMTQQVLKEKLSNTTSMKGKLIILLLSHNVHEEDLYDIYHL